MAVTLSHGVRQRPCRPPPRAAEREYRRSPRGPARSAKSGKHRKGLPRPMSRCQIAFARRSQSSRLSCSGRASGRTPARSNAAGSTSDASERRSILRRWPKATLDQPEQALGIAVDRRLRQPSQAHQSRLDPGLGEEHRRRDPAHHLRLGPVRDLDRRNAVGLAPGPGRQPLPHLALDHHQHAIDRRHPGEQVEHQRRGDVVRQVGHQRPPIPAAGKSPSSTTSQSRVMASPSTTRTPRGSTT